MALTSDELNYLIYRYLLEAGFSHAAFTFGSEALIPELDIQPIDIPVGSLIALMQKGLQFLSIEAHMDSMGVLRPCGQDFKLFGEHTCSSATSLKDFKAPEAKEASQIDKPKSPVAPAGSDILSEAVPSTPKAPAPKTSAPKAPASEPPVVKAPVPTIDEQTKQTQPEVSKVNTNALATKPKPKPNVVKPKPKVIKPKVVKPKPEASRPPPDPTSSSSHPDTLGQVRRSQPQSLPDQRPTKRPATVQRVVSSAPPRLSLHPVFRFQKNKDCIYSLAFAPQDSSHRPQEGRGQREIALAAGGGDGKLTVAFAPLPLSQAGITFNTPSPSSPAALISQVAWSTDGLLAQAAFDGQVIITRPTARGNADISTSKPCGAGVKLFGLRFSPCSSRLCCVGESPKPALLVRDGHSSFRRVPMLTKHRERVMDLCWLDSDRVVTAGSSGELILENLKAHTLRPFPHGHTKEINAVRYDPVRRILASGSDDGSIKLWNPVSCTCVSTLSLSKHAVYALALGGGRLVCGTFGGEVAGIQWRTGTAYIAWRYEVPGRKRVFSVAISPDGKLAAVGSKTGGIQLLDAVSGKPLHSYGRESRLRPFCLTFSHCGRYLAVGMRDGAVAMLDVQHS
eukprot:gnl/Dysnectes_brevis/2732_a3319_810.p1 GENE.gnl/Dysnectes_brevis/2732_a3319_810~~gnl/Dysnectes_brevis/2732_a3319_810.p1  ORF type:complete len:622 (+),score=172.00 gnl/Dysnectes_brevis/2732_a3319_810:69-1934(+)